MTEEPKEVVEFDETVSAVPALRQSFHYAERLRRAADAVASNFKWCHASNLRPILLLDFDVICGAFPGLVVQERLRLNDDDEDVFSMSRFWGPSRLRVLFQHVDDFVVPPGTAAELFAGMERLNSRLSERAESFIKRIRRASQSEDPSKILTNASLSGQRDILLEDLTRFDEDAQTQRTLHDLLSRAIPAEDLIGKRQDKAVEADAFRDSYGYLKMKRPSSPLNNLNDALNLALVVRLFNSNTLSARARRFPVLISETRAVRALNSVMDPYLRRVEISSERPLLFNDGMFLVIGLGLLSGIQDRYGIAGDEARQMAGELASIAGGCLSLINECAAHVKSGKPSRSVTLSDLPKPDIDLLYYRRELFERRWGRLFAPSIVAAEKDRSAYLRFFLSPGGRALLNSNDQSEIDKIARARSGETSENYALWRLLLQHRRTESESESVSNISLRAFDYYVAENDGTLLRNVVPERSLAKMATVPIHEDHNFRIVVLPAYVSVGALLSIASFRDSEISRTRYVSFTWLHKSDGISILQSLAEPLLSDTIGVEPVKISIYSESHREDHAALSYNLRHTLSQIADSVRIAEESAEFFEFAHMRIGTRSVFADLQMLEGTEMQANVTLAAMEFDSKLFSTVLDVVAATCEIPMTAEYLRMMIGPVREALDFGGVE
jgi:hypothetical protein